MRTILLPGVLSILVLSGCVVHHRHHRRQRHHPPPAEVEVRTPPPEQPPPEQPPPDRTPPPPPPRTHRAPPAPSVQVWAPKSARRGEEIELSIQPFDATCLVFFNGRPLPKKSHARGFLVTVPGNAESGHFEVECGGRRYRSAHMNVTP